MHKGNKATEPLGHGGAAAERTHVLELVQDQQHKGIRQAVEPVKIQDRVSVDSSLGMHCPIQKSDPACFFNRLKNSETAKKELNLSSIFETGLKF